MGTSILHLELHDVRVHERHFAPLIEALAEAFPEYTKGCLGMFEVLAALEFTGAMSTDGPYLVCELESCERETLEGTEERLLAIAPFVEEGGEAHCEILDGNWRWLFKGGKLFSQEGHVVYDGPEVEVTE